MRNWFKKRPDGPPRVATDTSPGGVYSGLREQALSLDRTALANSAAESGAQAWGVLMETGYDSFTATLLALADGTTSLYLSNGGGVIGGQGHETVRQANAAFLNQANQFLAELKPTSLYPIPEREQTVFYVLTDSGILTGGGTTNDFGYGPHPLSPLFHAGHEVIAQLRFVSEADDAQG